MQIFRSRTAATLAALAVVSMTATPVFARGYDDWGRHRHHRGGGVDGGSLLAGLLVGGAAVAIATSANKKANDTRGDEPAPYRYPGGPQAGDQGYGDEPAGADYGSRDYPGGPDGASGSGQGSFDAAVDACSGELEQGGRRVDSVDNVRRMGERYSVEGRLEGGSAYACSVDDTGHIRSVAVDGHAMI
ncbi:MULTISPECIES: hypothetical protein [unclassified Novosphingobium]|uniref:hypothetical protein n=1 Tax=unclassified Novosphingobium TaxID=2644732 RepID=UPI00190F14A9|nr:MULTISPECIES: hypothetical protein [unclassified Novosphingobium]